MRKLRSKRKRRKLYFDSLDYKWRDNYITHFRKLFKRYPARKEL